MIRRIALVAVAVLVSALAPAAPAGAADTQSTVPFSGLTIPVGVAVDAVGNVYAADAGNNRVVKLPWNGGSQVTLGFSGVSGPSGVAVDAAGAVYLADAGNNRILKLPAGGGAQAVLGFSGLSSPVGVAVDAAGTVYVADSTNDRVVKLPVGGSQSTLGFTGLDGPGGVAVDAAGTVFVTDFNHDRVVKLPVGGAPSTVGFSGLSTPVWVALDPNGNVYAADAGNARVVQLAPGGAQSTLGFSGLGYPVGLALDATGDVLLADSTNNRVLRLDRTAPLLRVTTSPALPADIVVDGVARDRWGLNWAAFPLGPHQVCFAPVSGFATPPCQDVVLTQGNTTTVVGTYSPRGYLRVLTSPAVASTVSVDGVARNDWGLWTEIAAGTHTVCFGAVAGFDPPDCRDVVVAAGATAETTGTFTPNAAAPGPSSPFGYLRAVTSPAVNAMISVDGQERNNWGLDWVKLAPGSHTVCFGAALDTTPPSCGTHEVTAGATTVVTGSFTPSGFLRVLTSPSLPATIRVDGQIANAYGVWTGKAPGLYDVCFSPVPGYVTPPCQDDVAVTSGSTATITGTYAPSP